MADRIDKIVKAFAELDPEEREKILQRHLQGALKGSGPPIVGGIADTGVPDEVRKEIQQETLKTLMKWFEVVGHAYYKRWNQTYQLDAMSFKANVLHSALLRWMLDGNEPLPEPPPCRFSNPWHQLVVDGEGVALDVRHDEERETVVIEQRPWKLLKRTETGYVVTYGSGKTQWSVEPVEGSVGLSGKPRWQLKRIDD